MELLSERQIDTINDLLLENGVKYDELRNDLLDHICCIVEEEVETGRSFGVSLDHALDQFGLENFKLIQESTMYLLNQKLNMMKKTVSITGLIASLLVITGVLFRVNHIPGAGILLVVGISSAALITFPMMAYMSIVAKEDKQTMGVNLLGFLSAMLLCMGALFKMMHWPLAMILFWTGAIILLFAFMPLHAIRSYRLAENKLFSLAKTMLIVAGIVLFWGISTRTRILKPDLITTPVEIEQNQEQ